MSTHTENKRVFKVLRLALSGLLVFNHIVGASFAIWGILVLSASVFSPSPAQAAPQLIAFQGRLTDANSNPRNETVSMTFSIHDALANGTELWSETQPAVVVSNGIFSAQLGSVTPIPITVFNADTRYLQVQVGSEILTPRQRLLSSPYALHASSAANSVQLGGVDASLYATKQYADVNGGLVLLGSTNTWTAGQTYTRALTVANTNFVLQNGNMGLGVSNPISTLHIAAPQDQLILEDSDGAVDAKRWLIKADGGDLQLLTANDAWNSWTAALQINRTGTTVNRVSFPNGNVGIGVAVPSSLLDVNGGSITVRGTNAGLNVMGGINLTGQLTMNGTPAVFSNWTVTGADIYRQSKVGIGTDNPSSAFDVAGGSVTIRNPYGLQIGTMVVVQQGRGNVGIGTMSPAQKLVVNTSAASDGISVRSPNVGELVRLRNNADLGGDLLLFHSNSTTVLLSGRAGVDGYFNNGGNVGIGTDAPGAKLQVAGGVTASSITLSALAADSAAGAGSLAYRSDTGQLRFNSGGTWTTLGGAGGSALLASTQTFTGQNTFINQVTVSSTVVISGNVGIGTTSPLSSLQIGTAPDAGNSAGRLGLYSSNRNDNVVLRLGASVANPMAIFFGINDDNNYSEIQSVESGVSFDRPLILQRQGGNVGIGTTNPSQILVVESNTHTYPLVNSTNAGGNSMVRFSNSADGDHEWYIGRTSAGTFSVLHDAGTQLSIDTSNNLTYNGGQAYFTGGNVGIGTTAPGAKLHVVNSSAGQAIFSGWGNGDANAGSGQIQIGNFATPAAGIISYNSGGDFTFTNTYVHPNADFVFNVNNSVEAVRITGNGNVGVGTTVPSSRFEVTGGSVTIRDPYGLQIGTMMVVAQGNGNVGIGSVVPAQALDVVGNIAVTGTVDGVDVSAIGTASHARGHTVANTSDHTDWPAGLTAAELGYVADVTSLIQAQLNTKAPTASPTFTGTVSGVTATMVGLGNVTNESKATMFTSPSFTGTVTLPTPFTLGAVSVLPTGTELNFVDGVTSAIQTQLNAKAPTASPTFTGTVSGVTATMVGLGNVTNESKATMFTSPSFTGTVTIGAGTGKLDVGTIDPVYTIGGKRFATYVGGMTGVKEETSGIARLTPSKKHGLYEFVIDFDKEKEGSDLWLFGKISDLKKHSDRLVVSLTPAFDGAVWYEKDPVDNRLTLYAKLHGRQPDSPPELSYRLIAPRFDSAEWSNISDSDAEGFNLDKLLKP